MAIAWRPAVDVKPFGLEEAAAYARALKTAIDVIEPKPDPPPADAIATADVTPDPANRRAGVDEKAAMRAFFFGEKDA